MKGRLSLDDAGVGGQQAPLCRDEIGSAGQELRRKTSRDTGGNLGKAFPNLQLPMWIAPHQEFHLADAAFQLLAAEMDDRFSGRQVRQHEIYFQGRAETCLKTVSYPLGCRLVTGHDLTGQGHLKICLRAGKPGLGRLARQRMPRRRKVRRMCGGKSTGPNLAAADSSPKVRLPVDVQADTKVGKGGLQNSALKTR